MKVIRMDDHELTEEEKETVDSIGKENTDYCVAAILQSRNPDKQVDYIEEETTFDVDGEQFDLDFDIIEEMDTSGYGRISKMVQTLELLLEIN